MNYFPRDLENLLKSSVDVALFNSAAVSTLVYGIKSISWPNLALQNLLSHIFQQKMSYSRVRGEATRPQGLWICCLKGLCIQTSNISGIGLVNRNSDIQVALKVNGEIPV